MHTHLSAICVQELRRQCTWGCCWPARCVLPVIPGPSWKPTGQEDPAFRILLLLAATVGLPYFLLSTTGPLIQAWYARRSKVGLPYRLYALSNAGSMFALLSYPILFEPLLTTRQQAIYWSAGYAVFILFCGTAAFRSATGADWLRVEETENEEAAPHPYLLWMLLPACASVLLMAVTNHLSQNVAAIPFLWVLPLSLYLLSFIMCFEGRGWYRRSPFLQLAAVALGCMAYALSDEFENADIRVLIPLFCAGLFLCCMVCHGEVAQLKPHPRYLTSFYLMLSLGGALGGVFVGMIAPRLFPGYFELPFGLVLCGVLMLAALRRDPGTALGGPWLRPAPISAVLLVGALTVMLGIQIRADSSGVLVMARNFYGGLKVEDLQSPTETEKWRRLMHGTINHGAEFLSPERRNWPTTYYGPNSGVGIAIRQAQERGPVRLGVIGLGTGTLASYGRSGDYIRFYEINPLVLRLARTEFGFVPNCKAQLDVAMGDARLSLEREPSEQFDVLAVDAFSSDSIPVHLLTKEAFVLFFHHMKPGGVVAVHVSNKYLDLAPIVQLEADELGKLARNVDTEDVDETGEFGSTWVLVTDRADFFDGPLARNATVPIKGKRGLRAWTDDYSNLFQILK